MHEKALPLVVVACVLVAGCATTGSTTPVTTDTPRTTSTTAGTPRTTTKTATTTTTSTAATEPGCPPFADLSPRPLPASPGNLTRQNAVELVRTYEENTTWNRLVQDEKISLGVSVTSVYVVDETETGYVLHVEGGFGFEDCLDGAHVAGDGVVRANYFVNESTVVRLNMPPNRTTDPRENGTVVEG